jgi:hypothetical protein
MRAVTARSAVIIPLRGDSPGDVVPHANRGSAPRRLARRETIAANRVTRIRPYARRFPPIAPAPGRSSPSNRGRFTGRLPAGTRDWVSLPVNYGVMILVTARPERIECSPPACLTFAVECLDLLWSTCKAHG